MTALERLTYYVENNTVAENFDFKADVKTVIEERKIQEQYAKKLEADNEKLRQIVNILCDTINQLV